MHISFFVNIAKSEGCYNHNVDEAALQPPLRLHSRQSIVPEHNTGHLHLAYWPYHHDGVIAY